MVSKLWALPFVLVSLCLTLRAQQPASPPVPATKAPPPQGLQAPWDIRQMLAEMNAQNQRLKPLLDQMHPQQWLDNGAPPAYASQYIDTRSRLDDVVRSVANLGQHTESLSAALDAYFRMEALEIVSRSLLECIRKYGEHATAEQLSTTIAQNYTTRQKFREYLRDLSVQREQECKLADEEAQRCRGIISKEPPPSTGTRRSR
jgi:hypothetical protein